MPRVRKESRDTKIRAEVRQPFGIGIWFRLKPFHAAIHRDIRETDNER